MIEWEFVEAILRDEMLTVTLNEITDSVITNTFSVTMNKAQPFSKFRDKFKEIINADRARVSTENALDAQFSAYDLSDFETFLNS